MKKYKLLISMSALTAGAVAPVITLASCSSQSTIKTIPESMLDIKANVLYGLNGTGSLADYDTLVIPENVVAIADDAFNGAFTSAYNSPITTIVFNKNLTSIGAKTFKNCDSISTLDFSNIQDIKIMSMKLCTEDGKQSFASTKNTGGKAILPDGITDMQKEWIVEQFTQAGLARSWFVSVSPDEETVTMLNEVIDGHEFNTMSEMIAYVKENTEDHINLEDLVSGNATDQFAWDKKENKIITLNSSGGLSCGPTGYTMSKESNIWKMVNAPSSTNANTKSAIVNADAAYADEFSSTTQFAQYLRTGQAFEGKSLSFVSSIDTGSNQKITLSYEPTVEPEETAIISVNLCSLTIEGSETVDATIDLYGTVEKLTVKEDSAVNLTPTSKVSEIVVTSADTRIKIEPGSTIGVVSATSEEVKDALTTGDDPILDVSESGVVTPSINPTIVTEDEELFAGGNGSKTDPWQISTVNQLKNFANIINSQTKAQEYHFVLNNDIDLAGANWTPVGTDDVPFKGTFDGQNHKISNFKVVGNTAGTKYENHLGFFGHTEGEDNTDYKIVSQIWNYSTNKLDETNISMDKYKTVIKDLTLEDVESVSDQKYFVGGMVGMANYTYFYNCKVTSGTVKGVKHVGGITGTSGSCIFKNCTVGGGTNNMTVTATVHNCGGISGSTGYGSYVDGKTIAVIGCKTESNCTVSMLAATNESSLGGIVGNDEATEAGLFDNCTNNASLVVQSASSASYGWYIGGIACHGSNIHIFNKCTNNGSITIPSGHYAKYVAGIVAEFVESTNHHAIIDCTNNGNISGAATGSMCGIASCVSVGAELTRCYNNGTINNTGSGSQHEISDQPESI